MSPGFHLVLHGGPVFQRLDPHEFYLFCRANPDWRFECTQTGDLIIIAPTGGETGRRNFQLIGQFWRWVEENATGIGFDSSTIFLLPNGAKRSPDMAWVHRDRWGTLTPRRENRPQMCDITSG
jgi:Uma2 family endonuclease